MLLRRDVDAAEMDEVYLEEDEGEGAFGGPLAAPPAQAATAIKGVPQNLTMVDAPSLRQPTVPTPAAPVVAPPTPPEPGLPPGLPPAASEDGGVAHSAEVPTEPRP